MRSTPGTSHPHDMTRSIERQGHARSVRVGLVTAAAMLSASLFPVAAAAEPPFAWGGSNQVQVPNNPQGQLGSGTVGPAAVVTRSTITVPLWNSSFADDGAEYGSTMVGTDPSAGSVTTTVPVVIVPLRLDFQRDDSMLDYPDMGQELASSSFFEPAQFRSGTTQYLDAYRRADFWNAVSTTSPSYHTLLGSPTITRTVTLTVPAPSGYTTYSPSIDRQFGWVDAEWFSQRIKELIKSLQIAPTTLTVLLAPNTAIVENGSGPCPGPACQSYGGYHGALVTGNPNAGAQPAQALNTYAYAEFEDLGDLLPPSLNIHLLAISHELLEWLDDPLGIPATANQRQFGPTNWGSLVPAWSSPYFGGVCSQLYEVADPLEAGGPVVGVPDAGHLDLFADSVFQSWFTRATPSVALGGRYDVAGALTTYSSSC